MAALGLAVVFFEFLGLKHVFAIGDHVQGVAVGLVKGVDHQRALDFHRLARLAAVEHQPAAKAADRRLVRLLEHGVGPHGHQFHRLGEVGVRCAPGNALVEIKLGAASGRCQQRQEGSASPPGRQGVCHTLLPVVWASGTFDG
jgi:hypothetical protein